MKKIKLLSCVIWHAFWARIKALKISGTHVPIPWRFLFRLLIYELWSCIKDLFREP